MASTFRRTLNISAALLGLALVSLASLDALVPINAAINKPEFEAQREVLYLPRTSTVQLTSIGYRYAVGHLLWFKTISYFGKHYASDRNYQWLAHMCDLVSTLNPKAAYVYQFCSNMLSWEAHAPDQSVSILDKAIELNPENWRFHYYRGITYLFFLKEGAKARDDFVTASQLPGAEPFVKRLAAKTLAEQQDRATAIEFLKEMLRAERDPSARNVLLNKLREIQVHG